jgi:hypothetical protein
MWHYDLSDWKEGTWVESLLSLQDAFVLLVQTHLGPKSHPVTLQIFDLLSPELDEEHLPEVLSR